jgi:hypothetical protein
VPPLVGVVRLPGVGVVNLVFELVVEYLAVAGVRRDLVVLAIVTRDLDVVDDVTAVVR